MNRLTYEELVMKGGFVYISNFNNSTGGLVARVCFNLLFAKGISESGWQTITTKSSVGGDLFDRLPKKTQNDHFNLKSLNYKFKAFFVSSNGSSFAPESIKWPFSSLRKE